MSKVRLDNNHNFKPSSRNRRSLTQVLLNTMTSVSQSRNQTAPVARIGQNTKMLRKVVGALAGLALVSALVGCGAAATTQGGQERTVLADKVISLSPSTTEAICGNTVYQGLVGKTADCNFPSTLNRVDNVVKGTTINYELALSKQPNLVVYDADLYDESDVAKFKEAGIEVFAYAPKTMKEYEEAQIELAKLTAQEARVSEMLDKLSATIQLGKGSIPEGAVSVAVLIGGGSTEYLAAGTGTLQADLLRNIHLDFQGPDTSLFSPINVEQLIAWNPDMILTTEEGFRAIQADSRVQTLSAVQNNRVFSVNPDILLRAGARLDQLAAGVEVLAQRIHLSKQQN